MKKCKVLIVDDSALVRKMLGEILGRDKSLEVVGTARDPFDAREKVKALNPDVLTLDVEMPKMDGLTFLSNLMRLRPIPVVMVSSLTEKGADVTLRALELGAIDFVSKPKIDLQHGLDDYSDEIIAKVKTAARARVSPRKSLPPVPERLGADAVLKSSSAQKHFKTTDKLIAIGASTGGTEAIREVISQFPPDMPGTIVTQHIPEAFSGPFAKRLNNASAMHVQEATDGAVILPGHVYIAPGNRHLLVKRSGARYVCSLNDGPLVNRHKPAVDVMFRSVAQNVGPNAIGVILTGMGNDGAMGLKEIKAANAPTIAQDEQTCVVWGMPKEAVKAGAVDTVLPLQNIAGKLIQLAKEDKS